MFNWTCHLANTSFWSSCVCFYILLDQYPRVAHDWCPLIKNENFCCCSLKITEMGHCVSPQESFEPEPSSSSEEETSPFIINEPSTNFHVGVYGMKQYSERYMNRFFLKLYFGIMPNDVKSLCLQYIGRDPLIILDIQYPFNSSIISAAKEKYFLIDSLQKHLKSDNITFKLLWRTSVNGHHAKSFHSKVDGNNNLAFIVEPKNNQSNRIKLPIFGGYTSITMTSDKEMHRDPQMFLFRLRGKPNFRNDKL